MFRTQIQNGNLKCIKAKYFIWNCVKTAHLNVIKFHQTPAELNEWQEISSISLMPQGVDFVTSSKVYL